MLLMSWLKKGAEPTDTVKSLLQRKGLWLKWSMLKRGADETAIGQAMEKWQSTQAEKMRRENDKKERRKAARKKAAAASVEEKAPAPQAAAPAPAPETAPAAQSAPAAG
jgi:small subunit ribosomal protein S16